MSQERCLRFVKSCHLTLPTPNPFSRLPSQGEEADARSSTPFAQDCTPAAPRAGRTSALPAPGMWSAVAKAFFPLAFCNINEQLLEGGEKSGCPRCTAGQERSWGGPAVTAFLIALTAHANNRFILPINSPPNNRRARALASCRWRHLRSELTTQKCAACCAFYYLNAKSFTPRNTWWKTAWKKSSSREKSLPRGCCAHFGRGPFQWEDGRVTGGVPSLRIPPPAGPDTLQREPQEPSLRSSENGACLCVRPRHARCKHFPSNEAPRGSLSSKPCRPPRRGWRCRRRGVALPALHSSACDSGFEEMAAFSKPRRRDPTLQVQQLSAPPPRAAESEPNPPSGGQIEDLPKGRHHQCLSRGQSCPPVDSSSRNRVLIDLTTISFKCIIFHF